MGDSCGSVGSAVAFNARGLQFYKTVNCIEKK